MSHLHVKLLSLAVSALLTGLLAATATAESGFTTGGGAITATADALRFESFPEGTPIVRCRVVLTGLLHDEALKTGGAGDRSLGFIQGASATLPNAPHGPLCDSELGANTVDVDLLDLPWNITVEGFTGDLPEIATLRIQISGFAFRTFLQPMTTGCSYGGDLAATTNTNVSVEGITRLVPGSAGIPSARREGPFAFLCPANAHVTGEAFDLAEAMPIGLLP
jgi:hypothetical protein